MREVLARKLQEDVVSRLPLKPKLEGLDSQEKGDRHGVEQEDALVEGVRNAGNQVLEHLREVRVSIRVTVPQKRPVVVVGDDSRGREVFNRDAVPLAEDFRQAAVEDDELVERLERQVPDDLQRVGRRRGPNRAPGKPVELCEEVERRLDGLRVGYVMHASLDDGRRDNRRPRLVVSFALVVVVSFVGAWSGGRLGFPLVAGRAGDVVRAPRNLLRTMR